MSDELENDVNREGEACPRCSATLLGAGGCGICNWPDEPVATAEWWMRNAMHWKEQHDDYYQFWAAQKIEIQQLEAELASLRARPQEPGKCPTNHRTVGGDLWLMNRHYTVKGEAVLWRPAFCPDCGMNFSAPSGPLSDPESKGELKWHN